MHDVMQEGEFTPDRVAKAYKIMVKTQFHRTLIPNVPDEKIVIVPNGMDFSLFDQDVKKDQYLLVNTSSPDRSMDVLPELFKRVKEQVPQARLKWVYGFDLFDKVHSERPLMLEWSRQTKAAMVDAGIENLGRVTQKEAAKLYLEGNVLAFPTEFAEIDCITVKKAQACGCMPVTTDFGALNESVQYGIKIHSEKTKDNWCKPNQFHFGLEDKQLQDQWVDVVVAQLKTPMGDRKDMREWTKKFSWDKISNQWHEVFLS
jgi:glycosyltransferase involved in cell wall biosynthesis